MMFARVLAYVYNETIWQEMYDIQPLTNLVTCLYPSVNTINDGFTSTYFLEIYNS